MSIAPVTRAPRGFAPPWEGFYEYFPLPRLRDGQDYVADLAAVCPVRADQLTNRRIACLSVDGLAALFHRLTLNSTRLDHVPDHFAMEAQRLSFEIELWEIWVNARGTEEGFQEWLDGEFGGQPFEDAQGHQLLGTEEPTGTTRRDALRWNREEIHRELEQFLARS